MQTIVIIFLIFATGAIAVLAAIAWFFRTEMAAVRLRKKSTFHCNRCGHCCGFNIILTQKDIDKIKETGAEEKEFLDNKLGIKMLKKKNGKCVFMRMEDQSATCSIYEARPVICKRFPSVSYLGIKGYDTRCKAFKNKNT